MYKRKINWKIVLIIVLIIIILFVIFNIKIYYKLNAIKESKSACEGLNSGDNCRLLRNNQIINGKCVDINPKILVCKPNRR